MQLRCEACSAPYDATEVNLAPGPVKCRACNAVVVLPNRARAERSRPLLRPRPALPRQFEVEEAGETTRISWRWFRPVHVHMGAVSLVWNAILAGVCVKVLTSPGTSPLELIFLLPHLGAGLWLLYFTLAGALNRTTITVDREQLTLLHGPLPWPGTPDRQLPGPSLSQLYCTAWRRKQFLFQPAGTVYELSALDASGHPVELVSGLEEHNQVLFLELALERQLGIEDAPVEGELATRIPA